MVTPFEERVQEMNLDESLSYKGMYKYEDQYGEVIYRQLTTMRIENDQHPHETDGMYMNRFAIYCKEANRQSYLYCGRVSSLYQFIGHDILNQMIRDSVTEAKIQPVIREVFFSNYLAFMRTEFEISSPIKSHASGDLIPIITTTNSYNGTAAAKLSFGLGIIRDDLRLSFAYKLGEITQVHTVTSKTKLVANISEYVNKFQENILETIQMSFEKQLTEKDILMTLEAIERIGKKRRDSVSTLLSDYQKKHKETIPSAWTLFLAIVHYSSNEYNLNIKRIMENAAESVLVIPARMFEMLDRIQKQ